MSLQSLESCISYDDFVVIVFLYFAVGGRHGLKHSTTVSLNKKHKQSILEINYIKNIDNSIPTYKINPDCKYHVQPLILPKIVATMHLQLILRFVFNRSHPSGSH